MVRNATAGVENILATSLIVGELIDMSQTLVAGCRSGTILNMNSDATMVEQQIVHSLGIFRTSSGLPCHQEV